MAKNWTGEKVDKNQINGGVEYTAGVDIVGADDVNAAINNSLYAVDIVDTIRVSLPNPNAVGTPSVTVQTDSGTGHKTLVFANIKGNQGNTGATGPQGPQGIQGATGPRGLQGPIGAIGPQGPIGATPIILATAEVDSNVGTPNVVVRKTGTDEKPQIHFAFKNLKGVKGDKGDTGAVGPIGPQGEQGPQGQKGNDGTNGTNGKDGVSITSISVVSA